MAVVCRERLAQAPDGTSCIVAAEAREGRARVLKPPDDGERGAEVLSVENRLLDVLEAHARCYGEGIIRHAGWAGR